MNTVESKNRLPGKALEVACSLAGASRPPGGRQAQDIYEGVGEVKRQSSVCEAGAGQGRPLFAGPFIADLDAATARQMVE